MPKGPPKKRSRAFYVSDRAVERLGELADSNYTVPSRYLEKLIDQDFEARAATKRLAKPAAGPSTD